jgi:DNA-directed RNA polymerase subunit H (RpoH/RPB5)
MNFDNAVERSFSTIRQMLADRGVDASSIASVSAADVLAVAASRNVFHVDLESCKTRIIYNMNAKFKLADMRKLLEDEAPEVFIVITRDKPTHPGRKGVDELGKDVQFFDVRELQYNVSHHHQVPPHMPIRDDAEIEEIVRRYRLKSRFHIPLILSGDPMARYLALKHGQVVRITRASPSAGTYIMYRCCQRSV